MSKSALEMTVAKDAVRLARASAAQVWVQYVLHAYCSAHRLFCMPPFLHACCSACLRFCRPTVLYAYCSACLRLRLRADWFCP